MDHKLIQIDNVTPDLAAVLIALLADAGYEGFEEKDNQLLAYIGAGKFDRTALAAILSDFSVQYSETDIAKTNWNEEWERNFPPVIIEDFCTVRAHFHHLPVRTQYEIVVTPKMSFGTGHHATTRLMMLTMRNIDFNGKSVFDFGTGTGILAILASMLGAQKVDAADNDEWSYENAKENVANNNVRNVEVRLGSIDAFEGGYDILLANINRHILLEFMPVLFDKTVASGLVLMSGLLEEDRDVIVTNAVAAGFSYLSGSTLNNWISLLFRR
jgi:ribosomal protein L11 methyltransferase